MAHDPRYGLAGIVFAMKRGAILHHEFQRPGVERFWLSTGASIHPAVGREVIAHPDICAGNDGLFDAACSQTFFYQQHGDIAVCSECGLELTKNEKVAARGCCFDCFIMRD